MKIQKYKKVASTLFTNHRSVRMRDGLGNNGTSTYSTSVVSIPSNSNVIILGTTISSSSSWPACFCVNDNTCPIENKDVLMQYKRASNSRDIGPNPGPEWNYKGIRDNGWNIVGFGNIGSGDLFVYMNDYNCGVNIGQDQGPVIMFTITKNGKYSDINKLNELIDGSGLNNVESSLSHTIKNYNPYASNVSVSIIVNIVKKFEQDEPLYNYNPISPIILEDNNAIYFSGIKKYPYNIKESIINNVEFKSDISFNISDIEFRILNIISGTDVAEIVRIGAYIPPTEIIFLTSGTCELQVYQRYFQNKSNLTGYGRKLFTIKINANVS